MRQLVESLVAIHWLALKLKVYLQYKAYIVVWLVSGIGPLVAMLIWVGFAGSASHLATPKSLYAYFAIAYLTKQITTIWVSDELCRMIRDSDIALRLTRPCWPCWEFVAGHVAGSAIRLGPAIGVSLFILLAAEGSEALDVRRLPCYVLAVLLSWTIQFSSGWLIGSLGFWLADVKPVVITYSTCVAIGGGLYAPLALLPPGLRSVLACLPFPSTVGDPVALLLPSLATRPPGASLAMAAWWSIFMLCFAGGVWRIGIRRFGVLHS